MFYLLTPRNVNSAEQNSLLRTLKTQIFKNSHSLNQTHISTITFSNWIYWCDYSSFISSNSLIVSLSSFAGVIQLLSTYDVLMMFPIQFELLLLLFGAECRTEYRLMYLLKQFRLTIEAILDKPTALVVAINGSQLW